MSIRLAMVVSLAVLCACSGIAQSHVSPAVGRHFKGPPSGVSVSVDPRAGAFQKPQAAWAGARSIYVLTWGSGSCPKIPTSIRASGADRLVIRTVELGPDSDDEACTADLAVTTSVVRLPKGTDATGPLTVQIDGVTTTLSAR